ncbi:hypothetical protein SAMN05428962_2239 [Paenibacillus sp. BC26]|nr:hypothetical protein SAMN05428962_2239 [Paenibacillus sp. BC26]
MDIAFLLIFFMFIVVMGLISLDKSFKRKLANDKKIIALLTEISEKIKKE